MKIVELIKILEKFDRDAEIYMANAEYNTANPLGAVSPMEDTRITETFEGEKLPKNIIILLDE